MKASMIHASTLALCCVATSAMSSVIRYPGKAEFLTAVHGDLVGVTGLASGGLTPRSPVTVNGNGRSLTINSDFTAPPAPLVSWGNGIGAPNPANVTRIFTGGRPTTAFGCALRVANNINQSVGGIVQVTTNSESFQVNVPSGGGMYLSFITSTPFDNVTLNATNGTLVEMIDDVVLADAAGRPASDQVSDAGLAKIGRNSFDTRSTMNDVFNFVDVGGVSYGNSRDVWWTFTPPITGTLYANTADVSFSNMAAIYDGSQGYWNLANVRPIASVPGSPGIQVHVQAGQIYYMRVGGGGGAVGTGDLLMYMIADCDADYNHDGVVDFFDYLDFVADFSSGC